jgi:signal transduction histidine kinase
MTEYRAGRHNGGMNWLTNDDEGRSRTVRSGLPRWLRPTGPFPRPSRREWMFDLVLALAIGVPVKPERLYTMDLPAYSGLEVAKSAMILISLGTVVPLCLRRRYPLASFWLILGELYFLPAPFITVGLGVVVSGYSAAVYSPYRRPALASLAVGAIELWAFNYLALIPVSNKLTLVPLALPLLAAATFYGTGVRKQGTESLAQRRLARELQQQETIRRAVEHERSRIARELHDVVTHNVSVMVVLAGAARKVLAADPDQATEALLAVEASGRAAMSELRQVMGLLTEDVRDREQLAPQPGLDQIGTLVERIRGTGVPIAYTVSGTPRQLPPGLNLTAYRVVQEALTNTVKHAVGARVDVRIEYRPDELSLDISDSGGVPGQSAASGNGKGLIGLHERVAVHGGSVRAGRRPDGGYRLSVIIPFVSEDTL